MLAVWGEDTVEAGQVSARRGNERGEPAHKLNGRQPQQTRNTRRRVLGVIQDLAVLCQRQASQRQRRTRTVTGESLQGVAVHVPDEDAGMQREALAEHAQAPRWVSRLRWGPGGKCLAKSRQPLGVLGEILLAQLSQQPGNQPANQPFQMTVLGRQKRVKLHLSIFIFEDNTVGQDRMDMDVQIQRRSKSLNEGNGAAQGSRDALPPSSCQTPPLACIPADVRPTPYLNEIAKAYIAKGTLTAPSKIIEEAETLLMLRMRLDT